MAGGVVVATANPEVFEGFKAGTERTVEFTFSSSVGTDADKLFVVKDADGNVITDYEQHIIHRKDGSELKEWYALASYIDSFDGGKVPVKKYGELQGRKVQENSLNPFKLLKQTNKFFWMITAAVVLVLALVALIVVLVVMLVRRMRYGRYGIRRKDMIFRR